MIYYFNPSTSSLTKEFINVAYSGSSFAKIYYWNNNSVDERAVDGGFAELIFKLKGKEDIIIIYLPQNGIITASTQNLSSTNIIKYTAGQGIPIKSPDSTTLRGKDIIGNTPTKVSYELNENSTSTPKIFYGLNGVLSLEIPSYSRVTEIKDGAFQNDTNLSSVTLNNKVVTVGPSAFTNDTKLVEVTFGQAMTILGNYVLHNTAISAFTIPQSVEKIGVAALSNCSNLVSIDIPSAVTEICASAFTNDTKLSSVTFTDNLATIGEYAFYNCIGISAITLPHTIEPNFEEGPVFAASNVPNQKLNVKERAFSKLSALKEIEIVFSATVGNYSFADDTSMTNVVIKSAATIGQYAFSNIGRDADVLLESDCSLTSNSLGGIATGDTLTTYTDIPGGGGANSRSVLNQSNFKNAIIKLPSTRVNDSVFNGMNSLTSCTIHDEVQTYGDYAFQGTGLPNFTIPSASTVGTKAFTSMPNITSITVGEGSIIGNSAVTSNSKLSTVEIKSGVTINGNYAFTNNSNLSTINIGSGTTIKGNHTFDNISHDCNVLFENDVAVKNDQQFNNSKTLDITTYINIPDSYTTAKTIFYNATVRTLTANDPVTSIGNNSFYGMTSMANVYLDNTVSSIGENAFRSNGNSFSYDINFYIGSGLTTVGRYAFNNVNGNVFSCQSNIKDANGNNDSRWLYGASFITYSACCENCVNPVTYVGDYAFYDMDSLQSVYINKSFEKIGNSAFYHCSNLTDIYNGTGYHDVFPETLSALGISSFYCCSKLRTKVTFPSALSAISNYAFYQCTNLPSPVFNSGNTLIGDYTFYQCNTFNTINLSGSTVENIGQFAFWNCSGLTNLSLYDNLKTIGNYAFEANTKLSSLFITSGVSQIGTSIGPNTGSTYVSLDDNLGWQLNEKHGGYAFRYNTGLTSIKVDSNNSVYCDLDTNAVYYPKSDTLKTLLFGCKNSTIDNNTKAIENYAFTKQPITSVTIPSNCENIGVGAFKNCTSLKTVNFNEGLKYVGDRGFYDCSSLTSLTIPYSLAKINGGIGYGTNLYETNESGDDSSVLDNVGVDGAYAFYNCQNLQTINVTNGDNDDSYYHDYECNALYKKEAAYRPNTGISYGPILIQGSKNVNTVHDGTNQIGHRAFYYITGNTTGITFPSSLQYVRSYAFYNSNFSSIKFNNSPSWIGAYAFKKFKGTTVDLGNSVVGIKKGAFQSSSITGITMPNTVNNLDPYAFDSCKNLWYAILPSGLSVISQNTFSNCGLSGITIPANIQRIEPNAFYNNTLLSAVSFVNDSKLEYIGNSAFNNDRHLTDIILPSSLTKICSRAFYYCTALSSITIPENVTSGESFAFGSCSNLLNLEISSSAIVKTDYLSSKIESMCNGDTKLSSVTLSNKADKIGNYLLANGNSVFLKVCNIPTSCTSIGNRAFLGQKNLTALTNTDSKMPDRVTVVSFSAFTGCGQLKMKLSDKITNIGVSAFRGCYSLGLSNEPLKLTDCTNVGMYAFCGTSYTALTIPAVTEIGISAFTKMRLTAVTIPSALTDTNNLGNGAFFSQQDGYAISSVTFDGDDLITHNSLSNQNFRTIFGNQVTAFTIPNGVSSIGDYKFYNCNNTAVINNLNWEQLNSIGSRAFANCNGGCVPSALTLNASVGSSAFSGTNIVSLVCNNGNLLGGAFYKIDNLADITFGPDVSAITGSYVFRRTYDPYYSVALNYTGGVVNINNCYSLFQYGSTSTNSITTLYVPSNLIDKYKNDSAALKWRNMAKTILEIPSE